MNQCWHQGCAWSLSPPEAILRVMYTLALLSAMLGTGAGFLWIVAAVLFTRAVFLYSNTDSKACIVVIFLLSHLTYLTQKGRCRDKPLETDWLSCSLFFSSSLQAFLLLDPWVRNLIRANGGLGQVRYRSTLFPRACKNRSWEAPTKRFSIQIIDQYPYIIPQQEMWGQSDLCTWKCEERSQCVQILILT